MKTNLPLARLEGAARVTEQLIGTEITLEGVWIYICPRCGG